MRKTLLLVPMILLVGTLAGCSVGTLPGSAPVVANGAGSTPDPASSQAANKAPAPAPASDAPTTNDLKDLDASVDVCALVPLSMVTTLTGRPYVSTRLVKAGDGNSCGYFGQDQDKLEMELGWYDGGHSAYSGLVQHYSAGLPSAAIPNLGNEADNFTEGAVVRYGNDSIISFDDIHPADYPDLPVGDYIKLIETLEATR